MSIAAWWYAGVAETELLSFVPISADLNQTLQEATLTATGQISIDAVLNQTLDAASLSSTATVGILCLMEATLEPVTFAASAGLDLLFIFEQKIENPPEPIIIRSNDYIGDLVLYKSKYGEESLIYQSEAPSFVVHSSMGVFNNEDPALVGNPIIQVGNWKYLFKTK